ncbi:unnamed protein product [Protopolystoma xenopodis]|uniref:Uncharacterized protein n=1 Tax=Protopolystoma xenopodis TaxID=117903 RepID=A0A448XQ23_9PLAT|nr:unnamed protein product [Protopolystoma xenopodis]
MDIEAAILSINKNDFSCFNKILNLLAHSEGEISNDCLVRLLDTVDKNLRNIPESLQQQLTTAICHRIEWITSESSDLVRTFIQLLSSLAEVVPESLAQTTQLLCALLLQADCSRTDYAAYHQSSTLLLLELLSHFPQAERSICDSVFTSTPSWFRSLNEIAYFSFCLSEIFVSKDVPFQFSYRLDMLQTLARLSLDCEVNLSPASLSFVEAFDSLVDILGSEKSVRVEFVELLTQLCAYNVDSSNKLTTLTWIMAKCVPRLCASARNELDWTKLCQVFFLIKKLFGESIKLTGTKSESFSFLVCYISSLKPGILINLVEFLWNSFVIAIGDTHSVIFLSYLADILVRLKCCSRDLIISVLNDMIVWCVTFPYKNKTSLNNRIYLAVCEAAFRIFVARHEYLLSSPPHKLALAQLPFSQIILSSFQPFDFLHPNVKHAVIFVALKYDLPWPALGLLNLDTKDDTHVGTPFQPSLISDNSMWINYLCQTPLHSYEKNLPLKLGQFLMPSPFKVKI